LSLTPSRRDVLTAFLGLPALAIAGCTRRARPAGELVGTDVVAGHRLRDATVAIADGPPARVPVVIVGSGIAGLSAAWRLQGADAPGFVLLELEAEPGGTSRASESAVTPYPWGAHYVPVPAASNRSLVKLLREMRVITGAGHDGEPVVDEPFLVADPEERVFYRGAWHEGLMPEAALDADDTAQMQRFRAELQRWAQRRDEQGRGLFTLPVARTAQEPEALALDGLSMAAWMDELGLRSARLRWYVDYACRDDYGCRLDTTSAWAGVFYFVSRMTPSGESAPLITWPEGNGAVVRHLAGGLGERLQTGQLAVEVVPRDDGVEVTAWDTRTGRARAWLADRVILAVPRFIAAKLLRPWRERPPSELAAFDAAPWVVANVHLRDRPRNRGCVPAWDNVFYDSPSLGYVNATHQRGRRFGPTVLTWYYALTDADPRSARHKLLSASREEWVDVVLTDLERAHPDIASLTERVDLCRWGHAMVRPRVGFVWGKERRQASRVLFDRVHVAHTELSGVALIEEAHYHGVRAAEEVLGALSGSVQSWL
jgi:protoporphyrinogen oxidase